jgi:hypothetical protein
VPTVEWDIPFDITTPFGTLELNQPDGSGRIFRVNQEKSVARRPLRVTTDPLPHADGEIFHDRFSEGYQMQFTIQLWQASDQVACDAALCEMRDELYGHIWSLLRPADDGGRITWTPSCGGNRLLDAVRLLELRDPEIGEGEEGLTEITFTLDSPFPYAISEVETVDNIAGSETLENDGNVTFYPVFKVNGATSGFTITNNDTGLSYVYDAGRPGAQSIPGGSYAEIDMFRGGIIYLNGNQDNLKPGVDVENSDILYIEAGGNSFTITGANADVLLHDAYA